MKEGRDGIHGESTREVYRLCRRLLALDNKFSTFIVDYYGQFIIFDS